MNFDINNYDRDKTAIHCSSEDEATALLTFLDSLGLTWADGTSYLEDNNYRWYKDDTCYSLEGYYATTDCYKDMDYQILESSDFEWDENDVFEPFELLGYKVS